MIGRLGKDAASKPPIRSLPTRAGERVRLRDRIRDWLGLAGDSGIVDQKDRRRRVLSIGLTVYLIVLATGAFAFNIAILREHGIVRSQVEIGSTRVAAMQRVAREVDAERQRSVELGDELARAYRELPGAVELPIVMSRLSELPTLSGGSASGVEYSEPRWSGGSGYLQTHATLRGSLREVVAYIEAMKAMLPTATLERLSIRLDREPGKVAADLLLSAAVIRDRPTGAPPWDVEAAWRRAEAAAVSASISGFPFTPGARLWQEGRAAGIDLPELRLSGVARQGDQAYALIVYDGKSSLVRSGARVGAIEVISVDLDGILVTVGGRLLKFEVAGAPQGI